MIPFVIPGGMPVRLGPRNLLLLIPNMRDPQCYTGKFMAACEDFSRVRFGERFTSGLRLGSAIGDRAESVLPPRGNCHAFTHYSLLATMSPVRTVRSPFGFALPVL